MGGGYTSPCSVAVALSSESQQRVRALEDDLQVADTTMVAATAFVRKIQREAAVAGRVAHAKLVVLQLSLERKSKEAQACRNGMEEAVGQAQGLQDQVASLTLRTQSLESLLRLRDLELEDARRDRDHGRQGPWGGTDGTTSGGAPAETSGWVVGWVGGCHGGGDAWCTAWKGA